MMVALAAGSAAGHRGGQPGAGATGGIDPYSIGFISENRWHLPRISASVSLSSFPRAPVAHNRSGRKPCFFLDVAAPDEA